MDDLKLKISPQDALLQKKLGELRQLKDSRPQSPKDLPKAAEDFESLFVYFMLRSMRKTVIKSGLLNDGLGGDIMESLFDQEISKKIAHNASLGVAELLIQQLASASDAREKAPHPPGLKSEKLQISSRAPTGEGALKYLKRHISQKLEPFEPYIREAALKYGLSADLIRAVIMAESSGNPHAVSSRGAKGLMQLMDATAAELGVKDPFDPRQNILGGAAYLAKMLTKFQGNIHLAVAGYNAGPDSVEKHAGIPPYRETQDYVKRIVNYFQQLKEHKK